MRYLLCSMFRPFSKDFVCFPRRRAETQTCTRMPIRNRISQASGGRSSVSCVFFVATDCASDIALLDMVFVAIDPDNPESVKVMDTSPQFE